MNDPLPYAPPTLAGSTRFLGISAKVTLAYPLFFLVALYANWLGAWMVLGHRPRASLDDPKDIAGIDWLFSLTSISFVGLIPMAVAALVLNLWYITRTPDIRHGPRVLGLLAIWIGTFLLMIIDPFRVLTWFSD